MDIIDRMEDRRKKLSGPVRAGKHIAGIRGMVRDVGGRVFVLRAMSDMSATKLAELASLTKQTICNLEKSKHTPHRSTVSAVAGVFGLEACELTKESER